MELVLLLGQEIKVFFNHYGIWGLFGILLSTSIISFVIYKVLSCIWNNNIETYAQFSEKIFKKHKIINQSIQNIVNIFLLISFFLMVIGFAAYFEQELSISRYIGGIFVALLCYVTFCGKIDRIIKVNELLMPVLIGFILLLGVKVLGVGTLQDYTVYEGVTYGNWWISSVLYASYNSILLIPILIGLKKEIKNQKQIASISKISMLCISIPAIIIYFVLYTTDVSHMEIPIIYIAKNLGPIYQYLYSFVILSAIYTSAVCAGYSFLKNVFPKPQYYKKIALAICTLSIFLCGFSFASLVQIIYPIFGCIGLIQIFLIILEKKWYN